MNQRFVLGHWKGLLESKIVNKNCQILKTKFGINGAQSWIYQDLVFLYWSEV